MTKSAAIFCLALWLAAAAAGLLATPAVAEDPAFTLDEAVAHGVVNWRANPEWPQGTQAEVDRIAALNPGMIYKIGIRNAWGRMGRQDFARAAAVFTLVHRALPRAILGIGLNETVATDYDEPLDCGAPIGKKEFRAPAMTRANAPLLGGTAWLDMATPTARDFYICQGEMFLDIGFTLIHFEEMENVVKHASSANAAWNNYVGVIRALRDHAAVLGHKVYFSGDPVPSGKGMPVDTVYAPSRFYHTKVPAYVRFQNKVARPGIGVGYSYTLSPVMADAIKAQTRPGARVFFYVDNWDPKQDDLRRMMELDAANRRFLITSSAKVAHQSGVYFIPSLDHCDGCIPADAIGDPCERLAGKNSTEYDAFRCGDVDAVKAALALQSPATAPR